MPDQVPCCHAKAKESDNMSEIMRDLREAKNSLLERGETTPLASKVSDVLDTLGDLQTDAEKALLAMQILQDDLHLTDIKIPQDTVMWLTANPNYFSTLSFIVVDYLGHIRDTLKGMTDPAAPSNEREES